MSEIEATNGQRSALKRAEAIVELQIDVANRIMREKIGAEPVDHPEIYSAVMNALSTHIGAVTLGVKIK